nr:HAMP domain-containing sensor histidine kinase [uncultured Sphaerochaeta sp.]
MRRTISLSKLNFLLVLLSLLVFTSLLSLMLFFGLDATQDAWYSQQITSLQRQIEERILEVYRQEGSLSEEALSAALEDLLQQPTYLIISDTERNTLYSYHKTDRSVGRARGFQFGQLENQKILPITGENGQTIAYYSLHLPTFSEVEANAMLVSAARNVLIWALFISLLVAVLLAFLFFLPLKKRSRELTEGLSSMANRQRDVVLKQSMVSEFADISEAAKKLQENLLHEERLRRQWAADIAHDLRSPVTVLKGQLEGVADGVLKLDEHRIELFLSETEKLTYMINDLSLLTHLESPGYAVHTEPVRVDEVLKHLLSRFEVQAKQRGMEFSYAAIPLLLQADLNLFTRLLDNLVSNAVRYGEAPSSIVIFVEGDASGNAVQLRIENEGIIEEAFLPRLFDRLSRAEASRTSEGTGLGLSIVKAIVDAHGWNIAVTSKKKTIFTLYFT